MPLGLSKWPCWGGVGVPSAFVVVECGVFALWIFLGLLLSYLQVSLGFLSQHRI